MRRPQLEPLACARWSGGVWSRLPDGPMRGVCHDSRRMEPGCLYVALRGERLDGHSFVAAAARVGAAAALVERGVPEAGALPQLVVPDSTVALASLARGWRRELATPVVGVTGSAGKTTVKNMTAAILAREGPVASTPGNWNNRVGVPLSLLQLLPGDATGVFEVGTNHPGELRPLCALLEPSVAIVTNVGPSHIEHFGSVRAIAEEKAELPRALGRDGVAVFAADTDELDVLRAAAPGRVLVVGAGDGPAADYVALEAVPGAGYFRVREASSGEECPVVLPVPGAHNVTNALLAIAAARARGAAWESVRDGLGAFDTGAMRWETSTRDGVLWVNDAYNANPLSMRAALAAFADTACEGRKWIVLGDMLELGASAVEEHRSLGERLGRENWWAGVWVVGAHAAAVLSGLRGARAQAPAQACVGVSEAAAALAGVVQAGDAVLLKGSRGMRLERVLPGAAP